MELSEEWLVGIGAALFLGIMLLWSLVGVFEEEAEKEETNDNRNDDIH